MIRTRSILPAFAILLLLAPAAFCKTFKVTDYGAKPDSKQDATPGVWKAISAAGAQPGSVVVFPTGTYEFWPASAQQKHYYITNHDHLDTRSVAMPLENVKGLTLDGQGSTFIFHGVLMPIAVVGSDHVTLENLTIDYAMPHLLFTKVISSGGKSAQVQVQPGLKYTVEDGHVMLQGEDWQQQAKASTEIDPVYGSLPLGARDDYQFATAKVKEVSPGVLQIDNLLQAPKPGNYLVIRGNDRPDPAIWSSESKDLLVHDVTVSSALGMAFTAQRSENVHLDGFNVMPSKGRILATNADATHFSNCRGQIIVENGMFENMLDDGINVHSVYLHVVKLTGPRSVELEWGHFQTFGWTFAEKGDNLEFVSTPTNLSVGDATVASVTTPDDHHIEMTLDRPLPTDLHVGDIVANLNWLPNLIYRNNTVRRARARGVLDSTPAGSVIEGNHFETLSGPGVLLPGDDGKWYEGKPSRDVVIRNNTFVNVDLGRAGAAIDIGAPKDFSGPDARYHHSDIAVLDNHFTLLNSLMVQADSVDGLLIQDNTLAASKDYPHEDSPAISLEHARCVRIENPPPALTLKTDDISQKDVQLLTVDTQRAISAKPSDWQAGCSQFTQKWAGLKP